MSKKTMLRISGLICSICGLSIAVLGSVLILKNDTPIEQHVAFGLSICWLLIAMTIMCLYLAGKVKQ